jgi:hypothetical protein
MALVAGSRLGHYETVSAIGAGGMGEVWRARDTKLGRDVALKVLPASFATDPERIARMHREAQVLAALNHPNIAAIYGFEDGDVHALVLEFVDGETLAARIARGPIAVEEALPIAKQIAEALEAAHEHGIVHRDLKPANIKVRPEGTVKVLDFGLAKLVETPTAPSDPNALSMSPTITSPLLATGLGILLGTVAYMSPEQARGKPADKRSDIWAFGCVLYEMLTGGQAFDGAETVSDAVAAILKNEPDWDRLPENTPASIRTLLRRCLQKDPLKRIPHIGVARIEVDEPSSSATAPVPYRLREPAYGWRVTTIGLVVMLAIIVALWSVQKNGSPDVGAAEMRTDIVTPPSMDPLAVALSPDGKQIAFVASGTGPSRLWVRSLASSSARPLDGTEGASNPFWSPDSRSVGFFAEGRLKRLDVVGGSPHVLAAVSGGGSRGATWGTDGVILFAPSTEGHCFASRRRAERRRRSRS